LRNRSNEANRVFKDGLFGVAILDKTKEPDFIFENIISFFQICGIFMYFFALDKLFMTIACVEREGDLTLLALPETKCWESDHLVRFQFFSINFTIFKINQT
jgi:hypothetical protein